tara:strand:- start:1563 stop:2729 length:1167 start_codon:yes stop_codon:yes gene_type:complete
MKFTRAIESLKPEGAFVVLAKAKDLESQGKEIIHLEIGQPDFPTPAHIVSSAKKSLDKSWTHGYTPSLGVIELRKAIAKDLSERRGVSFGHDEIIVCPGAKPALMATVLALVEPGTKLLYPDPGFPSYHSLSSFVNAQGVGIPLLEKNDFSFDLNFLEKEIKGASLLILNSPANPTGGILKKEDLEIIANLCIENNVAVLSDEVYSRMCYDEDHVSIVTIPGMKERTVLIDGFSKTYAMTGWRAGYAAADKSLIDKLGLFMNNNTSCVNGMTQAACISAIEESQDPSEMMIQEFKERRTLIVDGLNKVPGFSCRNPGGAFYAFPNIKNTNISGKAISDHMLNKGVALLPGEDFGKYGEGYIRLSYANSRENISKAIDILIEEVPKISR